MIDLHTHSTSSDGILSPSEFALYADKKNLKVWALTDHDTVSGLKEAAKKCLETQINFIPGIEIDINWTPGEFHLLGLGLKTQSEKLTSLIKFLTEDRNARNIQIVKKMNESGFAHNIEEIAANYRQSQLGRPHFADFLVKKGVVKTRQEAFDRFLGKGRPWYISHDGAALEDAVEAIVTSGGIPVIAHPMSLYVSWGKIEDVLRDFFEKGVRGLEAYHPSARNAECQKLEELARKIGFFVTAGSDFHGEGVRSDRHLGKVHGGKKISERFWTEELMPALGDFDYKKTEWAK